MLAWQASSGEQPASLSSPVAFLLFPVVVVVSATFSTQLEAAAVAALSLSPVCCGGGGGGGASANCFGSMLSQFVPISIVSSPLGSSAALVAARASSAGWLSLVSDSCCSWPPEGGETEALEADDDTDDDDEDDDEPGELLFRLPAGCFLVDAPAAAKSEPPRAL